MTTPDDQPRNTADLRGPGDPEEAKKASQREAPGEPAEFADPAHPERSHSGNIREDQQAHAPGPVPPSYVGSGESGQESKPEEAIDEPGTWDGDA
ncbi:hypothetical protein ACFWIX_00830 [Pseudarthrobacter sp. NPDC058362]|uniref:hypothetical protein n=1 Tax=Pseudarthrobacter sp. NPDC058362 TaxID=3346458 RepID=UPI00365340E2